MNVTFQAYSKAKKTEFMKSADNPLFRVFVTADRVDAIFIGFGSWLAADLSAPAAVSGLAGLLNAATSTSGGKLRQRDEDVRTLGADGCRTDHVNNFGFIRTEVVRTEAWTPSFLRRWVMEDKSAGRVRLTLRDGKRFTFRLATVSDWDAAQCLCPASSSDGQP